MAGAQVLPPFPVFTDVDGNPVDDGYIYVGQEGLDPIASPVSVFWDRDLTVPATQPIRTIGGYPSNAGVRSVFYSSAPVYSILVRNKNGTAIYSDSSSLSSTDLESRLADPTDPSKGAGMVGWERSDLSVAADKVSRMLDAQTVNIWEKQFTDLVTNFSTYTTDPYECDWAPALMAAFATGKRVYVPSTDAAHPYALKSKVVLPNTVCNLVGDGDSTLFALNAIVDHVFERIDDGAPGVISSVILENFKIDCIRRADWGLWIESSLGGRVTNVNVERFLVGGSMFGSDTASSGYYENDINNLKCNAGSFYSGTTVGMATYGIYLGLSATDNVLFKTVCGYVTEDGIRNRGGSNRIVTPHSYGNNSTDTGPKYCVRMQGPGSVTDAHNDNPTIAGIRIDSSSVQIGFGNYQWATGNTPTLGGAVPIEIETGLNEIVIVGGSVRGELDTNPTIRYLGTKPERSTVIGISPFTPQAGDESVNFVTQQLGVRRRAGVRSQISLDTPTGSSSALRLLKEGVLRYEFGITATAEGGGNTGSGLILSQRKDDASTQNIFQYFREFNLLEIFGQTKFDGNVGFYGTNPIVKPVVTGSHGGNVASKNTTAALASLGLITDSTTL
jgi:hypothetical protein